jgi:hypothetical protein
MYLTEMDDQNRESESIRHLLASPMHKEYLLGPMGLGSLSWIISEVNNTHLVPSIGGEVDILAGPLEFCEPDEFQRVLAGTRAQRPDWNPSLLEYLAAKEIAEAGGIVWPPAPAYVVGIEVKCAYFSDRLHSAKDSKRHVHGIRKQVERLANMGVDRVALLDVIANPPSAGLKSNAWFEAACRAQDSLKEMEEIIKARLPEDTAAAQFVWSVGSVAGGDESMRGAGAPRIVRRGIANPALANPSADVASNRKLLLEGVARTLGRLPRPSFFPAIFAGCRVCNQIRRFGETCDCAAAAQDLAANRATVQV